MRRKARTDDNQQDVVKQLRCIPGVTVSVTSMLGEGFPDLVIGYRKNNYLIELKDGTKPPSRKKLTREEKRFMWKWEGQWDCCENLSEILKVIGL